MIPIRTQRRRIPSPLRDQRQPRLSLQRDLRHPPQRPVILLSLPKINVITASKSGLPQILAVRRPRNRKCKTISCAPRRSARQANEAHMRGITPRFGTNAAQEKGNVKNSQSPPCPPVVLKSRGQSFGKFGMSPGKWKPKNEE